MRSLRLLALAACVAVTACNLDPEVPSYDPVGIDVQPPTAEVPVLGTVAFQAVVGVPPGTSIVWTVMEPDGGSISPLGLYQAPGSPGTYHVRALTVTEPAFSGTATVTVVPAATGPR
jgi:hypothetical protein